MKWISVKDKLPEYYTDVAVIERNGDASRYYGSVVCKMHLHTDAIALNQQLEAELKDEKNNHQHTIEIAKRQKELIKKLKNVIVRLNNERAHRDDQCGHAGPGIRDNF